MNLELTSEEASAVVAAIETLMDELLAASMSNTLNAEEARLYRTLGDVVRNFHGVESFYD
jgi:hypothetical protein